MSTETDNMRDLVAAVLAREGIEYKAAFVPQSLSRHSGEKDRTLNWRCTFSKKSPVDGQYFPNGTMAIDYSQGIGHIPVMLLGYNPPRAGTVGRDDIVQRITETGIGLPKPAVADIVYCLVVDSTDDHGSFEEWASDYGYDTDSRKAEETYNACRKQTRDAVRVFGARVLAELATILRDY
jgi:hypothetical protein